MRILVLAIIAILLFPTQTSEITTVEYKKQFKISKPVFNKTKILEKYIDSAPEAIMANYYIKKYAKKHKVPVKVVYRIARKETSFFGVKNADYTVKNYNPFQTSYADAYGALQIQIPTARWFSKDYTITKHDLLYNTKFNIELGVKYIKYLYERYDDWAYAAGFYNTGRKKINEYARYVAKNI